MRLLAADGHREHRALAGALAEPSRAVFGTVSYIRQDFPGVCAATLADRLVGMLE
ncbi:hypothetical protein [Nocardia sp. NPDC051463]|uniref:hypothetical protein n=1 Tax=Nocardia sp. NPDC051463 TaxID=3154845 RepID=UPI0034415A15